MELLAKYLFSYTYTGLSLTLDIFSLIFLTAMYITAKYSASLQKSVDVEFTAVMKAVEGEHVNSTQKALVSGYISWGSFAGPMLLLIGVGTFSLLPTVVGGYILIATFLVNYACKANSRHNRRS